LRGGVELRELGWHPHHSGNPAASETGHEQAFDNTGIASAEQRRERMIHVRERPGVE